MRSSMSKKESDIEGLGKRSVLVYSTGKNKTRKKTDKKTEIHRSNAVSEEAQKETKRLRSSPFYSFSVY